MSDVAELTKQLAAMAATLGGMAEPVEGVAPAPSAGAVTLYNYWSENLDGLKSPKLNAQYRTAICHLENRVRRCDDHGLIVVPLKRQKRRSAVRLMGPRQCPKCRVVANGLRVIAESPDDIEPAETESSIDRRSRSITNTPRASELNVNILTAWVCQLNTDGFSAETSRRLLTQVRGVLYAMVDAGENVRPPRRMPGTQRGRKRIRLVAPEDIAAVYEATKHARRWSPVWWRTLICGTALYGFRPSEITSILWKGPKREDIREGIYWGQKPPHDELREGGIENAHGWTVYLPGKQRRIKPDPLILPNSRVWREHLIAAKKLKNATGQVLPMSDTPGDYTTDEPAFRAEFARLKVRAGVSRAWTFRDLRRNVETRFARQFDAADAMALTGHANRSVSGQSYLDLVVRLVDEVDKFELTTLFLKPSTEATK